MPTIEDRTGAGSDRDEYMLKSGDLIVYFDEVEATGYGYWKLRDDGDVKARLTSLSDFDAESTSLFREIQNGD